jgi:hypothetical protein
LKNAGSLSSTTPTQQADFSLAYLVLSLMIGFIAGVLAGIALNLENIITVDPSNWKLLLGIAGSGYTARISSKIRCRSSFRERGRSRPRLRRGRVLLRRAPGLRRRSLTTAPRPSPPRCGPSAPRPMQPFGFRP